MRRVSVVSCTIALLLAASIAPAQDRVTPRRTPIEDRSGRALSAFHAALERARRGAGRARISVWGASHTASDQFTGFLRAAWQRRHGDAGPGFVLPALPFPLYEHRLARFAPAGSWRTVRVWGRQRATDAYGPAGFGIEATRARGFVALREGVASVDRAALHVMRQPGGGTLEVRVDGAAPSRHRTEGSGADVIAIAGPLRRLSVRATGDGPVRVFGVSLERDAPGVIVDAMGIPGARMRDRLPWRDAPLRAQLEALAPDLIVLAYGTNESGFARRPIARYRAEVEEAVRRARETAPRASCLLIGPSDWPERHAGALRPRARTEQVIAVQRDAAARHGCGFFDLMAWMGGPMSMPAWVGAGLALGDHVHFTDEGHRLLARDLGRALVPRP